MRMRQAKKIARSRLHHRVSTARRAARVLFSATCKSMRSLVVALEAVQAAAAAGRVSLSELAEAFKKWVPESASP